MPAKRKQSDEPYLRNSGCAKGCMTMNFSSISVLSGTVGICWLNSVSLPFHFNFRQQGNKEMAAGYSDFSFHTLPILFVSLSFLSPL